MTVAVDTSTLIAFMQDDKGKDVEWLRNALTNSDIVLPPVVLSEILSDWTLSPKERAVIQQFPLLDIIDGYWERVGLLRAKALKLKRKAKIADTLIAQSCIDHAVPLLTRDEDFAMFQDHCDLILV